ncbi:hypothetical protein GCM10009716_44110 [Streptomyces sodiiphilus]|uniref:2Fe-2S ferredoxin-type domain-containing protein n=1 Tax=Streptomyces sodiiphilus TaxID=226217 RepID=A0ABN2PU42_9ACTN
MSKDQQPNGPAPHTGWGGEYDPEATAFVQLPDGGLPGDPLAAPGHGYAPPEIGEALGPPATPAPTTDPAATGQWTLPFAGAGGPGGQEGADRGRSGAAAAMGQGAAAALAGSHQGRSRRRPLGEGGTGHETAEHPERESGPAAWEAPPAVPAASGGHAPDGMGHPADAPPGAEPAPPGVRREPAPEAAWSASSTAGPSGGGGGEPGAGPGPGAPGHWSAPPEGGTHPTDPGSGDTGAWQLPSGTTETPGPAGSPAPGPERDPGPQPAQPDVPAAPAPAPDTGTDGEPSDGGHTDGEAATDGGAGPAEDRAPALAGSSDHPETSYTLRVNGIARPVTGSWIGESLLYVLRERLGLAGAKDGCSQGECGACSVLVDGRLVAACLVPAATAAGCEIRTCEGLADADGNPSDVQRALAATDVQCGFCLPGMAMTVHDLLEGNHDPTELETRQALCGNLCRCTGYRGVLEAVRTVVEERTERAARAQEERDEERNPPERPAAVRIPHQAGPAGGDT